MWEGLLADAWAALDGDPAELDRVVVSGPPETLGSTFPATAVATAAIAASLLAASEGSGQPVALDSRQVAVAIRSERHVARNGRSLGDPFDPLSTFLRTADGWLRLHANYSWHRAAALRVLGCPDDLAAVQAAAAGWPGIALEDALHAAGGAGAAVRDEGAWRASEAGAAVGGLPLLDLHRTGDAPPRPGRRPRVLDLTRVIAGPVATRTLGVHGAEVLRLDQPGRAESPLLLADTTLGKRSALLDLGTAHGRRTVDGLLVAADAVALGYRPGALDRYGLAAAELAARFPGLIVLTLSAWSHAGPWSTRRGFDSLVQAATGIATAESPGGAASAAGRPGALPAQVLDHATGYLGAAAVLRAVGEQRRHGGSWQARCSLAQTAHWLLGLPRHSPDAVPAVDPAPYLVELATAVSTLRVAAPPGRIGGQALEWSGPPPTFGADAPAWSAA